MEIFVHKIWRHSILWPYMSRFANNALLGGGVRVWIREQRKALLSLCWQSWTSGGTSKQSAKVFSAKTKNCVFHQFAKFSPLIVSCNMVWKDSIPKTCVSSGSVWLCMCNSIDHTYPHIHAGSDSVFSTSTVIN